jgi:hypothetical protein
LVAAVAVCLSACGSSAPARAPDTPKLPTRSLTPPPAPADGLVRAIPDLQRREPQLYERWLALGMPAQGICMEESKAVAAAELRIWADRHYTVALANEALWSQERELLWQQGWQERQRRLELEQERSSIWARHEHTVWLVTGITLGLILGKAVFSP